MIQNSENYAAVGGEMLFNISISLFVLCNSVVELSEKSIKEFYKDELFECDSFVKKNQLQDSVTVKLLFKSFSGEKVEIEKCLKSKKISYQVLETTGVSYESKDSSGVRKLFQK